MIYLVPLEAYLISDDIEDYNIAKNIYSKFLLLTKDKEWDFNNFRGGICVLLASSLLKKAKKEKYFVYSLHPLVHLWCIDGLDDSKKQTLETAIIIIVTCMPQTSTSH